MTTGPAGYGRPATAAEREAFRADCRIDPGHPRGAKSMCRWTCTNVGERPDQRPGRLCEECADEYFEEVNPNSERNRTLRAARIQEAATPATSAEWQQWRKDTTFSARLAKDRA